MSHSGIPFLKRPQVPHNLLQSAVGQPSLSSRLQSKSPSIISIQVDFIILQHQTISEDEEEREHRPQSGLKKKSKKPGIVLHAFNRSTLGDRGQLICVGGQPGLQCEL